MSVFEGYRISSPYGLRTDPITQVSSFHAGIDLVKSDQAPIPAFTGGRVIFAGAGATGSGLGGYGNVVAVRDASNRLQLYGHLNRVSVAAGADIKRGQVIGLQGSTGEAVGSHLHYEVRKTFTPQFGWTADREAGTLEPGNYLIEYYSIHREEDLMPMKIVVIDPGHGMTDPGTVSGTLKEKDLTLGISRKIADFLQGRADVRLTRNDDTTFSADKTQDLSARADFANKLPADFFLSVHINAGGGSGFESYTYNGTTDAETDRISGIVHAHVAAAFTAQGLPDRGRQRSDFAVLRLTKMPAMLAEYGFIDNAADAALLASDAFLTEAARATADGIAEALALPDAPNSGPTAPTFPDIKGHWAEAAIRKVISAGIMSGYPDGSFKPNEPITRAEVAVIVAKLLDR
ncbi:N-acetylmuramoyl-L-alanine amidase [Gorillibacterium massiliense]|uniref:N-acetylmuramoyl-L-alanine amidase n=1 Tax=Gorillibacterium massiliense TaxID=1280390 RepID=UPI0004B40F5D|nr:N-acetylmuramoyl-L-alanine amidase [Gorillibacterium massiliense]